jgi:hypothetical protein
MRLWMWAGLHAHTRASSVLYMKGLR